jgi:hypothetical protein
VPTLLAHAAPVKYRFPCRSAQALVPCREAPYWPTGGSGRFPMASLGRRAKFAVGSTEVRDVPAHNPRRKSRSSPEPSGRNPAIATTVSLVSSSPREAWPHGAIPTNSGRASIRLAT